MKKRKVLYNLKKVLIVIMCSITLFFSMPAKAEATVIGDIVSFLLILPDGIMKLLNETVSGTGAYSRLYLRVGLSGADEESLEGTLYNIEVTPYDIFTSGLEYEMPDFDGNPDGTKLIKIPLLDINFFKDTSGNKNASKSTANVLRPAISNVYKSLRNLVLVLMLVVLLYIGVRIIVSTAVSEQVKYKQWLVDWVVGICLVVLMQYIMSFLMNVNEIILEMLGDNKEVAYYMSLPSRI